MTWHKRFAVLIAFALLAPHADAVESTKNRIRIRKKSRVQLFQPDNSEAYNAEKMEMLGQKRNTLIMDIKRFIQEARNVDQKGELNLRLAGLFMEEYAANNAKAQASYDKQLKEYEAKKKTVKGLKPPKYDNSEALASIDRARAIYRDLLVNYPGHPRRDEMIFFMGQASLDRGLVDEGMTYFKQLVKEQPDSRFVNDALVQLGDHHFEKNDYAAAEMYFDQVVNRKFRPLMAYSLYKKGWCAYNTARPKQSIEYFKWVIENEDVEENNSPVRVKPEALKDITLPFVDLNIVQDAVVFFRKQGDAEYRKGLETMGLLYFEKGNYPSSIYFYETLLSMDINFAKNPEYDIKIVEALDKKGDQKGSIERMFAKLPIYMENSNWYEINLATPETTKQAVALFEETARKYAFRYHAEAQKTKNENLYNTAKSLYAKYIEYFPRTPHTSKIRFYFGEILYKQNLFVLAGDQYWLVYKDVQASANMRLDSIKYALRAFDRQLNDDRKKAGLAVINTKSKAKLSEKVDEELKESPLSDTETKFVEIAAEYVGKYETQKDTPDVLYTASYLRYMHHDFPPALEGFWMLVTKWPKHETAIPTAYLILDILNRQKNYPSLITACKKLLENPSFQGVKGPFRADVADVLRKSELKRIALIEAKEAWKDAGDNYMDYVNTYGNQDAVLHEKALYNASVNYDKALMILKSVETKEMFLRRFPGSTFREQMLLSVAKTYETLAIFDKAGAYFETFATSYPKNAQASAALRLAGLYHWGAGNVPRAEKVMLTYLSQHSGEDAKIVQKDLLSLYQTAEAIDKETGFYVMLRSQKGISAADYVVYSVRIAELMALQGAENFPTMEEAMKLAQRAQKDILSTPAGVEALSKVYFWSIKAKEEYFYSIKLTLPQDQLEASLGKKLQLMKDLDKEYMTVASLGSGEWGLGSLYKIASIYRHMSQTVLQAPVPAELTAEQIELYRGELSKQMIQPFNEKAQLLAAQCLDKSQEFNLLSSWTSRCYSLASELNPDRYPTVRSFYLPSLQTALLLPNPKETKIPVGRLKAYSYPFYSSNLFKAGRDRDAGDRQLASASFPSLYDAGTPSGPNVAPVSLTYGSLADERSAVLKTAYENERPEPKEPMSFSYLNLMRLMAPAKAVPLILQAITKDHTNPALFNLLGLAYLEAGNIPGAKVTWFSMMARDMKFAAVWNNLGLIANLEGNEDLALDFFHQASIMESPREALVNLAFTSLKYRNGFEAKKHLVKALAIEKDDAAATVGMAVAQMQTREFDPARESLIDLAKRYKKDPYARLALGYFLMDVEKDNELARRLLSEYIDAQSGDTDVLFRQALQETRHAASSDGSLPTIE